MKELRWLVIAAMASAGAAACGDENETSGTVTPEPPETLEPAAGDPAAAPGAVQGAEAQGADEEPGPVVSDPTFELRADAEGSYPSGELGQFAITLTPLGGYHVNEEFPLSVELEAPVEVGLSKSQLEKDDTAEFGEDRARFDVPFTPTGAGAHRVNATVSFAVCTPETCIPDERTLALVVPVE